MLLNEKSYKQWIEEDLSNMDNCQSNCETLCDNADVYIKKQANE